jgi:hypothetical protein
MDLYRRGAWGGWMDGWMALGRVRMSRCSVMDGPYVGGMWKRKRKRILYEVMDMEDI